MPAASGPAENAEFGAMRMVEPNGVAGCRERSAEVELRAIGQQGASDDGRMGSALVFDDHAGSCAHDISRRFVEYAPARFSDLGNIDLGVHLREDHQRDWIIGIECDAEFRES